MYLPKTDGRFLLDHRDANWNWQPVNRFATFEAALANVRNGHRYQITDAETGEQITAEQTHGRPGVLTMTNAVGRKCFIRKPGTVPALGLNRKPLERGFAVNPSAQGQPMPTIDGADDPAFAEFVELGRRGAAMNAASGS